MNFFLRLPRERSRGKLFPQRVRQFVDDCCRDRLLVGTPTTKGNVDCIPIIGLTTLFSAPVIRRFHGLCARTEPLSEEETFKNTNEPKL
jgi:hypothetical protein